MSNERRQFKRYRPNFIMKAMMIPYLELPTGRHQLDPLEGLVLDYSDGGVKVHINNNTGRDLTKSIWLNQELYVILQLSNESYYTLKGKVMRFSGHPRDEQFDFSIMFVEEKDATSLLPLQDIDVIREQLRKVSVDAEEIV